MLLLPGPAPDKFPGNPMGLLLETLPLTGQRESSRRPSSGSAAVSAKQLPFPAELSLEPSGEYLAA